MSILSATILGIIQGLTEFLPVSSSGHLVLAQELLSVKEPGLSFAIWAHVGTTGSTLIFLWKEITWLLRGILHSGRPRESELRGSIDACRDPWRVIGLVLLGSVPAALVGLAFNDLIEEAFSSPLLASSGLLFTGFVLFLYGLRKGRLKADNRNLEPFETVNWKRALTAGVAQALAVLPGVSRSGMTIVAGVSSGMHREDAARFSFFLALVAVAGGALLDVRAAIAAETPVFTAAGAVGAAAALLTGLAALALVFRMVRRGNFAVFAYYCWAAGLAGMFLSLRG